MASQISGFVKSATDNADAQRLDLERKRLRMAEMSKNFEVNWALGKQIWSADKSKGLELFNEALKPYGKEISMEQADLTVAGFDVVRQQISDNDPMGAQATLKRLSDLGAMTNIRDIERASALERESRTAIAGQQSTAIQGIQGEAPQ